MALSNEEILLKERIKAMLSARGKKIAHIAETPTMEARLGRQINGEAAVPFTTLYKLLYEFHDIDANWLILGEGQMTKNSARPNIINHNEVNGSKAGGSINVGTSVIPVPVQMLLDEKDKRIEELEKNNATLRMVLDSFGSGTRK
jgi:hypothetical protein